MRSAYWFGLCVVAAVGCDADGGGHSSATDAGMDARVRDGGAAEPAVCDDGGGGWSIKASDYDQTCETDADCVAVGEGDACYPCVISCAGAAISARAKAAYLSDLAGSPGAVDARPMCHCPLRSTTCCLDQRCVQDEACFERKK